METIVSCLRWLSLIFDEPESGSILITRRLEKKRVTSVRSLDWENYVASEVNNSFENIRPSELCWTRLFKGGYIGEHVDECFSCLVDNEDETDAHGLQVPYDVLIRAASID